MSIHPQSFLAFTAELSKIAFQGPAPSPLRTAAAAAPAAAAPAVRGGMLGRLAHEGWHGAPGSKIPTWAKGMQVGMTALQVPGVFKEEDPTGQGRSRAERGVDLAAQTGAGVVGMGAASAATRRLGWQAGKGMKAALSSGTGLRQAGKFIGRNIALQGALPMALSYGASKLLTTPWRRARQQKQQQMQQEIGGQQPPSPNPGSGAAQTPIAQEGQQGQLR